MDEIIQVAQKRAEYVRNEIGVRQRLALAYALRELGFSHSGLAKRLDVTEGTTKKYVQQLDKNESISRDMYNDVAKNVNEIEIKGEI